MKRQIVTTAMISLVVIGLSTHGWAQTTIRKSPLSENAALAYWQAFASMPDLTDEQDKLVRDVVEMKVPVSDAAAKIVGSSEAALRELHRGAKYANCEWGLDYDDGPNVLLSHLGEARQLARLGCLRAIVRMEQGDATGAIDDLAAVLALGRDAGNDGVLISLLVQYAIEWPAIRAAAKYLPALDANERAEIADRVAQLRASKTMADAMRVEKELLLGWCIRKLSSPGGRKEFFSLFAGNENLDMSSLSELPDDELLAAAKKLRPVYDEFIASMTSSPDELDGKTEDIEHRSDLEEPARHLGAVLLPAAVRARRTEAVHQTRLLMLRAAIAVLDDGPEALKRSALQDPYGDGPFQYAKRGAGFQLKSDLVDRKQQPVTMAIGSGGSE